MRKFEFDLNSPPPPFRLFTVIRIGEMRFDAVTAKLYKVEHVKSNLHNIASTLKLDNLLGT